MFSKVKGTVITNGGGQGLLLTSSEQQTAPMLSALQCTTWSPKNKELLVLGVGGAEKH